MNTLVDGTILNNSMVGLGDVDEIAESLLEEIHLHIERPTVNIAVVILEIRVTINRLKPWLPAIMFGQKTGKS